MATQTPPQCSVEKLNAISKNLKIAVVHDWMFSRRGGEKVLEHILDLLPNSELFVLFGNPEKVLQTHEVHKVNKSFLASVPGIEKIYKFLLPFYPVAAESHDLSGFDLVVSSSSCAAKGVIVPPGAIHVSYLHSPMRYAWDLENTYFPATPSALSIRGLVALLRRLFMSYLRIWDVTSAQRVDEFCANSAFVQRRAKLYYGKEAVVIYPPVPLTNYLEVRKSRQKRQPTVLLFGAWVPYKKMELALKALSEKSFKVIAAGQGDQFQSLQREYAANKAIEFVSSPSDAEVLRLYERSHVLVFPGVEDFGIVPVEAMAAGVWVVGPAAGGTLETILPRQTGFHFAPGNLVDMLAQVDEALALDSPDWSNEIEMHLQKFSPETFKEQLSQLLLAQFNMSKLKNVSRLVAAAGAKQ